MYQGIPTTRKRYSSSPLQISSINNYEIYQFWNVVFVSLQYFQKLILKTQNFHVKCPLSVIRIILSGLICAFCFNFRQWKASNLVFRNTWNLFLWSSGCDLSPSLLQTMIWRDAQWAPTYFLKQVVVWCFRVKLIICLYGRRNMLTHIVFFYFYF